MRRDSRRGAGLARRNWIARTIGIPEYFWVPVSLGDRISTPPQIPADQRRARSLKSVAGGSRGVPSNPENNQHPAGSYSRSRILDVIDRAGSLMNRMTTFSSRQRRGAFSPAAWATLKRPRNARGTLAERGSDPVPRQELKVTSPPVESSRPLSASSSRRSCSAAAVSAPPSPRRRRVAARLRDPPRTPRVALAGVWRLLPRSRSRPSTQPARRIKRATCRGRAAQKPRWAEKKRPGIASRGSWT